MQIIEAGTVFFSEGTISAFPSACNLGDGDVVVCFQHGPVKNHADGTVCLTRSSDGGRTWTAPEQPFRQWAASKGLTVHAAYLSEVSPGRLLAALLLCDHLGDPELPFFNPDTGGALPMFIGLAESGDGGRTWSEPRILSTGRFDNVPVAIMSPIIKARQDLLLLPFETSKNYNDPGDWRHYAAALVSKDDGKSWDDVIIAAHDPEGRMMYWDHRMITLNNDRCLDFFYTFDNSAGKQTTAHKSISMDAGLTWLERPIDTGLEGQPYPIWLGGDEILVLTVDRYGDEAIKAILSPDLGDTWVDELVIYKHGGYTDSTDSLNDNLAAQQMWCFGLPFGMRCGAREVMVVWYCGTPEETRIESAKVVL
jgi:hypothetical protein